MLFRQVRSEGSWPFVLELHPRITVLAGLGNDRQAQMATMLETALYGRPTELLGTVELDGQEIDLRDWATRAAPTSDRADLLIRAADMPLQEEQERGDDVAVAEQLAAEARREFGAATARLAKARSAMARMTARSPASDAIVMS